MRKNTFYFFPHKVIKSGNEPNLDSHHTNLIKSKSTITSKVSAIGKNHFFNIVLQIVDIYAKLLNQYIFKYRTVSPVRFDKQDEDHQVSDKSRIYINSTNIQTSTRSGIDNIDFRSQIAKKNRKTETKPETKNSGWSFDRTN